MKPNERTCQHHLAHVFVERGGQVAFTSTTPEAKHQHFSVTSLDNVLQTCGVKMIKQQQERSQLDKNARLSHYINGPNNSA